MLIFPAIDIVGGKAVRLYKGDYSKMTVYSDHPSAVAEEFAKAGASCIHIVDLEGAKSGEVCNLAVVSDIIAASGLYSEIGGGIRSFATIEKYLSIGVDRVILGTAAVNDRMFLEKAAALYGGRLAVGVDVRDGLVAVNGWTEKTTEDVFTFLRYLQDIGIQTVICTDISKDGAMMGTNRELYRELNREYKMNITASGGVSSLDDVMALKSMGMYGAIIGKAYYTGAIDLKEAVEAAR